MWFRKTIITAACMTVVAVSFVPSSVYAADAAVIFGSDSYESESGTEFPVGVYIDGDSGIGYYRVEITYDPARLEYLGGATSGGDGKIIFEGNGDSERVSTMLNFKALSGGETQLAISDANVRVSGTEDESFVITERAAVPVKLAGEDVTATTATEEQTTSQTGEETTQTSETETVSETEKRSGDSSFLNNSYFLPVVILVPIAGVLAAIITALSVRNSKRKKKLRREYAKKYSKKTREINETKSQTVITEHGQKNVQVQKVDHAVDPGVGKDDSEHDSEHDLNISGEINKNVPEVFVKQPVMPEINRIIPADQKNPAARNKKFIPQGDPVIRVKNVSMTFKVSSGNASGLKDYMIQKAKGNMKKRNFHALDNISFDVYKGEVVGIIGTNGSGKSTLLKIVSGALMPTSGEVIADKKKIQLLSLGTGFDGELSARENVYLNGAIIGYTKEFIDDHYDEIVEFAELQNFMEEKVKNFSSGMVSRLGFSIATVAGAAEILILDEVLSVGDQFFRKKSLERIQQMIHGGSTVLIVSHSMPTIRAHCTKVVWIEKGKLRMVGDTKKVCDAYVTQQNNNDPDEKLLNNKKNEIKSDFKTQ